MKTHVLLGLTALALSPGLASAGFIGPGDFGPGARVITYDNLGLPFVNETTLIISGDAYGTFADNHLLYDKNYGQFVLGLTGGALATDIGHETTRIVLATDEPLAGIEIGAAAPWSATVTFFDASHALLATGFFGGNGLDHQFAGWQSATGPVHEIDIVDTSPRLQNMYFKDLTTGTPAAATAAPEPASLTLLGVGLATLCGQVWRKSRRRVPAWAG